MTYRVVETYERVTFRAWRRNRCPVCNQWVRRQRTFSQTVNPYNRWPNGEPKTRTEVQQAVEAEAAAWQPVRAVFTHEACVYAAWDAEEEARAQI